MQTNDCFILADAGGGTVDVVSYQVKKVQPHLELEKVTAPTSKHSTDHLVTYGPNNITGGKFGSAFVDLNFKRWLRDEVLGPEIYGEIDPINARQQRMSPHAVETGAMRELMKQFEIEKKAFKISGPDEIKLDLPAPLDNLSIDGRAGAGTLTIKQSEHFSPLLELSLTKRSNEMQNLINPCVNGVIKLIEDQIVKVGVGKSRRVKVSNGQAQRSECELIS